MFNLLIKTHTLNCVSKLYDMFGDSTCISLFNILKDDQNVYNVSTNVNRTISGLIDKIIENDEVVICRESISDTHSKTKIDSAIDKCLYCDCYF
jgi:hypothetical protein